MGFSHSMSLWPWDHIVTPSGYLAVPVSVLAWPSSGSGSLRTAYGGRWPPGVRQPCRESAALRVPQPAGRALPPGSRRPFTFAFCAPCRPPPLHVPAAREPVTSSLFRLLQPPQHPVLSPLLEAFLRRASPPPRRYFRGAVLTSSGVPCGGPRGEPAPALRVCGRGTRGQRVS